ncbi:MAG TPA: hypothetical protein VK167_11585 [Flavipsychrobacter sp.]|nr:hypothetical protein [Flavipsychrobacter sp.]
MDAATIIALFGSQLVPEKSPILKEIEEKEKEIEEKEKELGALKGVLSVLKEKHAESIEIKWREEVRLCLFDKTSNKYFLSKHHEIIGCIEYKKSIKANRKIKNALISTLSIMHKEKELGRIKVGDDWVYGYAEVFEEDLNTIKDEYKYLLDRHFK